MLEFLSKKAVGLDIADRSIEIVELGKVGKSFKVIAQNRLRLAEGIVERGRILNTQKLANVLTKLLQSAQPQPIESKDIIFGLPESQIYTRVFTIKSTRSKDDIDKSVTQEIKRNIPLPEEDLVFAYSQVPVDKKQIRITISAVSKKILSEWDKLFHQLGLKAVYDVEALAVYRGLALDKEEDPVCVVDIGAAASAIYVFDKDNLAYEYSVTSAGVSMTKRIAKKLKITQEEAEDMKKKENTLEPDSEIGQIVAEELMKVIDEVKKGIKYFQRKSNKNVRQIIVVGGSSQFKNISDFLAKNTGLPVRLGEPHVKLSKSTTFYLEAIGLALRGLEKYWDKNPLIEYYNQEIKKQETDIKPKLKPITEKPLSSSMNTSPPVIANSGGADLDQGKKLRQQKLLLLIVLIVGVLLIAGAFWFRSKDKASREQDNINQINQAQTDTAAETVEESQILNTEEAVGDTEEVAEETVVEEVAEVTIIITDTPTGWLNAREGPGTNHPIVLKVFPEEEYELIEEDGSWYHINLSASTSAWIFAQYAEKKLENQ